MYLVLRPPWGGRGTAPSDAGVIAMAPVDAGVTKPKKKKRRPAGVPVQPGDTELDEPELPPLSEADRRLEWRGDEVVLPATKIDMAAGGEARTLDDSEINATVSGQTGGVRDCVVQGATGTDLRATITIKLLVDGTGRVTRSKLQAPHYLFEKGLLGCAQRAFGRLRFPASGAPTIVTFPVNLG
ncbi:MAG: hypothetical protein H6Q90_250 [Deltaproteobacteria bacterium]|nr:hypothetical protein [Deltaproteobacteria bacterium]